MNDEQIVEKLTQNTKGVFLTHVQGFNGLTSRLIEALIEKNVPLIEDVCESHGAVFNRKKLGSFGLVSNFSFYYAHHMSTIEGGMVCTNDETLYETIRMLRSHGMVRESSSDVIKQEYAKNHPDLNPDFIFAFPAYNVRNTEIGAVLGRRQLKTLEKNNAKRKKNFKIFLDNLDPTKYRTDFNLEGSCNYAFNLILNQPDTELRGRIESSLLDAGVEFRRGSSGGGNQLRQPYMKKYLPEIPYRNYPQVEHIHFYGYYIGNHPGLEEERILALCELLNGL